MESIGSTVDGLEQICRQQNSLYTEAEVRADPYSAFNSMYNSGRGNFLLRCNEFVLSRFSPCLDSRSHSYAYASEAHRYYKRLYERGGVVTRLDSLKYRGKIFLPFSSFSCKLHIFNLFAFLQNHAFSWREKTSAVCSWIWSCVTTLSSETRSYSNMISVWL